MRKKDRERAKEERTEKYPLNIRQALYLAAAIIGRIEAKRLDKRADESLISTASEPCGEKNEN